MNSLSAGYMLLISLIPILVCTVLSCQSILSNRNNGITLTLAQTKLSRLYTRSVFLNGLVLIASVTALAIIAIVETIPNRNMLSISSMGSACALMPAIVALAYRKLASWRELLTDEVHIEEADQIDWWQQKTHNIWNMRAVALGGLTLAGAALLSELTGQYYGNVHGIAVLFLYAVVSFLAFIAGATLVLLARFASVLHDAGQLPLKDTFYIHCASATGRLISHVWLLTCILLFMIVIEAPLRPNGSLLADTAFVVCALPCLLVVIAAFFWAQLGFHESFLKQKEKRLNKLHKCFHKLETELLAGDSGVTEDQFLSLAALKVEIESMPLWPVSTYSLLGISVASIFSFSPIIALIDSIIGRIVGTT